MENIISVKNLSKSYNNKKVINNLNFSVKRGEVFGLLGANGAGKSTTIECILGTKAAPKGNPQFMATVLGFEDNYILVDPYKGDEAINSMDMALVSKDVISKIDVPDVKEGDKVSEDHQEFTARYNADEVIVLLSTFDVDESGGDGSLNPNSTYTDWNWILVRKNDGKWKHVDHGY